MANINAVGNGIIPVCHSCNVEIEYDEINRAVRRWKGGKLPGIDEIAILYLKRGGECVLELLLRMFNECFREVKGTKGAEECKHCTSI